MKTVRLSEETAKAIISIRHIPDFVKFLDYLKLLLKESDKELRTAPLDFVAYSQGKAQFLEDLIESIETAQDRIR